MTNLGVVCVTIKVPLCSLMQAGLVKEVAFSLFASNPHGFEGHPANLSLTWRALEALEGDCIVKLVECMRSPLFKAHVPASVHEALQRLVGHRNVVSHPFIRDKDWSDSKMKQFVADGHLYESRIPLVWALQQALNSELESQASPPLPGPFVTIEMAHQLRLIWSSAMTPINVAGIPDDSALVVLLRECSAEMLRQGRELIDGRVDTGTKESTLHKIFAEFLR